MSQIALSDVIPLAYDVVKGAKLLNEALMVLCHLTTRTVPHVELLEIVLEE